MASKERTIKRPDKENKADKSTDRFLILHNDDVNSFDYVIETLIDICGHDSIQAEQCAFITHFKGKCDVRKGSLELLKLMKDKLVSKGLSATID
ncbi:MAG: ATP-dependent Clp protease adaptor ClpS [Bacteroidetes bacterium]|nr:ATP-dependent Clp protease adaptor ClpS [Bacteroidota bacterium]